MFERLGNFVSRNWGALLAVWIVAFILLKLAAPKWDDVVYDGEFRFLPNYVPSRQAEDLFAKAFSRKPLVSSIVVVAQRNADGGLQDEDKNYIEDTLVPRLKQSFGPMAEEQPAANETAATTAATKAGNASAQPSTGKAPQEAKPPAAGKPRDRSGTPEPPIVASIRTFANKDLGPLLVSDDNKATLVLIELTTDFTERKNEPVVAKVEQLIGRPGVPGELQRQKGFPAGLDLSLSGLATVGRDVKAAGLQSARATQRATVILVLLLLFAIYRAPILAVIPLLTVAVSVEIAIMVLSLMAQAGIVRLFAGLEVYVTVVLYGAGVDYCMFLMSRYKEELDNGATFDEAISISVNRVGHALAASAATVACGIGMMYFTRFGKFQEAGIAMSFSLIFVLTAALTLSPAVLRLAGRWTFWPRVASERLSATQGWVSPTSMISRLLEKEWFGRVWDKIGQSLLVRPGKIWVASFLIMVPFAVLAVLWQHKLSYGLLSELPANDPSVVGAEAVQKHFPAGITGPVTMLVEDRDADFRIDANNDNKPGWQQIQDFVDSLYEHRQEFGIADIRSIAYPLGMTDRVQVSRFERPLLLKRSQSYYVSDKPGFAGQVTLVDVILTDDPFSPGSITQFDRLKAQAANFLPAELKSTGANLDYLGATASIRDLKTVTGEDQVLIDVLVPAVVFLILVILLRRIATCAYLIFTVYFSYLVTLGVTFLVFYLAQGRSFAGVDWKVPMFLFTILVAVGEDYNILLMTRIEEEQREHGRVHGIVAGLRKTGGIISSCGIIMAGTFSALLFGTLEGLAQLGFALAFGVLLDTFVVRPVLVPAYLVLLNQGWFGALGRFLGAEKQLVSDRAPAVAAKR